MTRNDNSVTRASATSELTVPPHVETVLDSMPADRSLCLATKKGNTFVVMHFDQFEKMCVALGLTLDLGAH